MAGARLRGFPRPRTETGLISGRFLKQHAGAAHASLIRNPANLTAAATDKICLTCHLNQPTQVGRLESSHARNQVACTACHKVHESRALVVRQAEATNK